jgi:hypothetical protein
MLIKIKIATKKDRLFLLNIRNQIDSRKFSFNKNIISVKDHNKWFKENFFKKNFHFYIIIYRRIKIGYVRIEKKTNNRFFVSISIMCKWQNLGLSKIALRYSELMLIKTIKLINLFAKISKNNKKSISLFKSLNYQKIESNKNFIIMKKKISKINYLNLINKIENIRKKNNSNWMDILKIAFEFAPEKTSKTMFQIHKQDSRISNLTKKLTKK